MIYDVACINRITEKKSLCAHWATNDLLHLLPRGGSVSPTLVTGLPSSIVPLLTSRKLTEKFRESFGTQLSHCWARPSNVCTALGVVATRERDASKLQSDVRTIPDLMSTKWLAVHEKYTCGLYFALNSM